MDDANETTTRRDSISPFVHPERSSCSIEREKVYLPKTISSLMESLSDQRRARGERSQMRRDSEQFSNVRQVEVSIDLLGDRVAERVGELLHGARLTDVVRAEKGTYEGEKSGRERRAERIDTHLSSAPQKGPPMWLPQNSRAFWQPIRSLRSRHSALTISSHLKGERTSQRRDRRGRELSEKRKNEPRESESHLLTGSNGKERSGTARVCATMLVVSTLHRVLQAGEKRESQTRRDRSETRSRAYSVSDPVSAKV